MKPAMFGVDLFGVVVALVILGVIFYLLTMIPLAEPFPTLIKVVVILAAVLWLYQRFLA